MPDFIEDFWFTSSDGLRLHALSAGRRSEDRSPVICLPGISRTAEDFRTLLKAFIENGPPRQVLALDSRGRGLSQYDTNPANYSIPIELSDLVKLLGEQEIERAIFIGTSRGGLLTMALASIMPQAIAGAVLNDIGPVIEMAGLLRIKGYVGKMNPPQSWPEAIASLKKVMGAQFPALSEQDWESYARRTWSDNFKPLSDPALAQAFHGIDASTPPPTLWPQFEILAKAAPVLVIRGEHSDLLSRETADEMKRRGKNIDAIEIAGQGHAPIIEHTEITAQILRFVERCDRQPR